MHKIFLFLVLAAVFAGGYLTVRSTLSRIYKDINLREVVESSPSSGCDEACQKTIKDSVSQAVATLSAGTKTVVVTNSSTPPRPPSVSYVPLDGTFSTTLTGWTDAPGIEVSFDLAKDFGTNAKASWEASLKVADANGIAYARLFDVTHGIAVSGSEIFITNSADFQRVSSGNLNLWSGRNVYRVQIKSLNSLEVDYTAGKIRISI